MGWKICGLLTLLLLLTGCTAAQKEQKPLMGSAAPTVALEQQKSEQMDVEAVEQAPMGKPTPEGIRQDSALPAEKPGDETTVLKPEDVPEPPLPTTPTEMDPVKETGKPEGGAEEPETAPLPTEQEAAALQQTPAAVSLLVETKTAGTLVKENDTAMIDYSNTADGYVMVKYHKQTEKRLKAQVVGPTTTYTYNLEPGTWAIFSLSDGDGTYKVTVYENVSGSKYAAALSLTHAVQLNDEFAPFLHPNQYVDYAAAPETVAKAAQITAGRADTLQKVKAVYDYTVTNISYDKEKAATVKSGYLPVLDRVLAAGKGICFDYAALMTGMLRSQGIPCKLVVGYAGEAYHAWISVWTQESGWMDSVIFFDGNTWKRMDPTFASSGQKSDSIMAYIGDGKNYTAKYFY